MQFLPLEDAGVLEVEYLGESLDLYSFGVFHLNMQDVIDKVSFWSLSQEGILEPSWKRPQYLPKKPAPSYQRFIRPEVRQIQLGSLYETISFAIANVLADPNTIAVLQNLGANVIWAIGLNGVRGVARVIPRGIPTLRDIPPLRRTDPFDVGPNIRDIALAFSESNNGRTSELKIKYRSPYQETIEVTIVVGGDG